MVESNAIEQIPKQLICWWLYVVRLFRGLSYWTSWEFAGLATMTNHCITRSLIQLKRDFSFQGWACKLKFIVDACNYWWPLHVFFSNSRVRGWNISLICIYLPHLPRKNGCLNQFWKASLPRPPLQVVCRPRSRPRPCRPSRRLRPWRARRSLAPDEVWRFFGEPENGGSCQAVPPKGWKQIAKSATRLIDSCFSVFFGNWLILIWYVVFRWRNAPACSSQPLQATWFDYDKMILARIGWWAR